VTVTFYALWLLCVLGMVAFAASAARRARELAYMAIGWAAAVGWTATVGPPAPEVVGSIAFGGALLYLFRPRYAWAAAACGGVLAGVAATLLGLMGAPRAGSIVATALVVAGVVWLVRRRPAFAPEVVREEALLVIGALGLGVAMLPRVLDGWQAAVNLGAQAEPARAMVPAWTVFVLATSSVLGGAYSLWSRR
jgi:hypothetical protein